MYQHNSTLLIIGVCIQVSYSERSDGGSVSLAQYYRNVGLWRLITVLSLFIDTMCYSYKDCYFADGHPPVTRTWRQQPLPARSEPTQVATTLTNNADWTQLQISFNLFIIVDIILKNI